MPLDAAYVEKAEHNKAFLDSLDVKTTLYLDWVVTIAFYVAVRYVDAYFCPDRPSNHQRRLSWVRRRPGTRPIEYPYRELENQSREARYELVDFTVSDVESLLASQFSDVVSHMKGL